jgi:hypothetical protein
MFAISTPYCLVFCGLQIPAGSLANHLESKDMDTWI